MSLIFIDGFDHHRGSFHKWNNITTTMGGSGRLGGSSIKTESTSSNYFTADHTSQEHRTWILGVALYMDSAKNDADWQIGFTGDTGASLDLMRIKTTGMNGACFANFPSSTIADIYSGPAWINSTTWYYLELKFTMPTYSGTFGSGGQWGTDASFEFRINGSLVINGSNLGRLRNFNGNQWPSIRGITLTAGFNGIWWDDLYICNGAGARNNDFLGDSRVLTSLAISNGTTIEFSPIGLAQNYLNANKNPGSMLVPSTSNPSYNQGTYNTGTAHGATDLFHFAPLTGVSDSVTIHGLQISTLANKSDAGNLGIQSIAANAATAYGFDYILPVAAGSNAQYFMDIFEQNPTGPVNWVASAINASQFGYRATPLGSAG